MTSSSLHRIVTSFGDIKSCFCYGTRGRLGGGQPKGKGWPKSISGPIFSSEGAKNNEKWPILVVQTAFFDDVAVPKTLQKILDTFPKNCLQKCNEKGYVGFLISSPLESFGTRSTVQSPVPFQIDPSMALVLILLWCFEPARDFNLFLPIYSEGF